MSLRYTGAWMQDGAFNPLTAPTPNYQNYLYGWGINNKGQIGDGTTTSSPIKQVGTLSNWLQVSAGYSSIAVKTDGTLWSWGKNLQGQLGLGNTTYYSSPKQIGTLTNWLRVSAGYGFTLAVKTDGTLWSWGANDQGQLGLGNTTNRSSPNQVGSLTNWLTAAAGYNATLAIKTDGTLWAWGYNNSGMLGLGNTTSYSSPKQVGALTNWLKVTCGGYHVLSVKTDGTLWSWGKNNFGQLGLGNTTYYSSPKQIGALTNWLSVAGLYIGSSSSAIKTNNTLWTWGRNQTYGVLGLSNTYNYSSPKQVGSLTNWSKISMANNQYAFALKTDGTFWSWGRGISSFYSLGDASNDRSSPVQVGSSTSWQAVSAAPAGGLALGY